jgi:cysteine-rich repeat protein
VVVIAVFLSGLARPGHAVSFYLSVDKVSHQVGEQIVVTLTGDATGGHQAPYVFAAVEYGDPPLVDGLSGVASQDAITSLNGAFQWTTANAPCTADGCEVFNQLNSGLFPDAGIYTGVLSVPASAPGTLTINLDLATFAWFGTLPPAGSESVQVEIHAPPPLAKISDTQGGLAAVLADADQFGAATAGIGDLDGDGVNDVAIGAHLDDLGGIDAGAVYILFLNSDGSVKDEQKIGEGTGGLAADLDADDRFGSAIALVHDLDGDGIQDLAVGAPNDDDGATNAGALYLIFLESNGTVRAEQKISNLSGGLGAVNHAEDGFGVSPTAIGDLDGDGVQDLAVGSFLDTSGGGNAGSLYILFMNTDGTVKASQKITEGVGGFVGSLDTSDRFGSGLANLGDLDGDGRPELAVGARFDGANDGGAIYLLSLNANGTVHSQVMIESGVNGFDGPTEALDKFTFPARIGDLDGNGVGDLAVGACCDDDVGMDSGAVWILFLTSVNWVGEERKISILSALEAGDQFGSVSAIGDLDGDGVTELAVGAPGDDDGGSDRGATYVAFMDGVAGACGNDVLDPIELCDDGNTVGGDGCSATCGIPVAAEPVPALGSYWLLAAAALLAGLGGTHARRLARAS